MKNSIITSSIVTAVLLFSGCGSSDSSSDTTTVTPVVATVASIVFGNSGATDYTITSSSNSAVAEVNATDPALYLTIGKRYKFSVTNFGSHPLSLNNSAGTALLSMGTVGTFEADTDVNYSYDNNGSMMFTLTASLAESLNTYRCINHAAMTGSIVSAVDATVVLGNSGSTDYTITSTTNTAIAAVNANDPTLNLTVGKRYKFSVTNFASHPLHFTSSDTTVLLGMGSNVGSFETDTAVNFVDNGQGSIVFTLTQALADAMNDYRCENHAGMTGSVTVTGGTPIVNASVVFGNNGPTDYVISSTTNTAIAAVNANDPTLNLSVGKRYKFTVTNFGVHPMLLNDASGSTLLGMGSANGSLESDADVNFVDDGAGSITFTLTQALANSLSVYRCSPHAAMTGDISITGGTNVNASVVFGNNGPTDYVISSTTNTAIAAVNANDPTLNLTVGKRYKFTVTNFGVHPMLLNDASGSTLLGMGSANGSLESDADVNFVDDGAGSITFTLTQALANSLSVYRCSPHAAMTGDIATN